MDNSNRREEATFGPEEFLNVAVPATEFDEVTRQIIKEQERQLFDRVALMRGKDWATLANQVVGSEDFGD